MHEPLVTRISVRSGPPGALVTFISDTFQSQDPMQVAFTQDCWSLGTTPPMQEFESGDRSGACRESPLPPSGLPTPASGHGVQITAATERMPQIQVPPSQLQLNESTRPAFAQAQGMAAIVEHGGVPGAHAPYGSAMSIVLPYSGHAEVPHATEQVMGAAGVPVGRIGKTDVGP